MTRCGFTARHHRGSAVVAERSADIHGRGNVAKNATARHHRGSAVVAERSADIHDRGNVAKKNATARHHRGSAVVAERSVDIHDRGNVAKKMLQLVITDEVAQSSNAWCVNNRGGNPLISLSCQQTVCIMYSEGNRKAICSKDSSLWACTHWSKPCCILPM